MRRPRLRRCACGKRPRRWSFSVDRRAVDLEVKRDACATQRIPIVRRASGGATIVSGQGCLMYAVVLSCEARPELRSIDVAHCFVLGRMADALRTLVPGMSICGTSDLAWNENADDLPSTSTNECSAGRAPAVEQAGMRKFSGNSLRIKRRALLYHGTLLYDFDLGLLETYLLHPPRDPGYRDHRAHSTFVANLPVARDALRAALVKAWEADTPRTDWPQPRTAHLVNEKYGREEWNLAGQGTR